MSKRIHRVSFDVEQRKLEDVTLALAKSISIGALKSGFRTDYIETVEDDDPRYADEDVATPTRNHVTASTPYSTPDSTPPPYEAEEPRTCGRAPAGGKQVKDYVLDYMLMTRKARYEEVGLYLANESARYQETPFKASSASPALSLLGSLGVLLKPNNKNDCWKVITGLSDTEIRSMIQDVQIYKRKERVEVL